MALLSSRPNRANFSFMDLDASQRYTTRLGLVAGASRIFSSAARTVTIVRQTIKEMTSRCAMGLPRVASMKAATLSIRKRLHADVPEPALAYRVVRLQRER